MTKTRGEKPPATEPAETVQPGGEPAPPAGTDPAATPAVDPAPPAGGDPGEPLPPHLEREAAELATHLDNLEGRSPEADARDLVRLGYRRIVSRRAEPVESSRDREDRRAGERDRLHGILNALGANLAPEVVACWKDADAEQVHAWAINLGRRRRGEEIPRLPIPEVMSPYLSPILRRGGEEAP